MTIAKSEQILRQVYCLFGEVSGSVAAGKYGTANSALLKRIAEIIELGGGELPADAQELIEKAKATEKDLVDAKKAKPPPELKAVK